MKLRLVGDIHGKSLRYLDIIKGVDHSIQIGDMGFNYNHMYGLGAGHKFFAGNHDNHDILNSGTLTPFWLGKYGELNGDMFFVGGGFSIDREIRIKMNKAGAWGKTYFENEELTVRELQAAIDMYYVTRPRIMLSHEAPRSIIKRFTNGGILRKFGFNPETFTTITSQALQVMFEIHQPEQWYFGHYHKSWSETIDSCKFTCINELDFVDIEVDL